MRSLTVAEELDLHEQSATAATVAIKKKPSVASLRTLACLDVRPSSEKDLIARLSGEELRL